MNKAAYPDPYTWEGDLMNAIAWHGLEACGYDLVQFSPDGRSVTVRMCARLIRITFEEAAEPIARVIPAEASC